MMRSGDIRRTLVTGISGQTGSYLAELLLDKGYEVHGTVRRASSPRRSNIDHIADRLTLHQADLLDSAGLVRLLQDVKPHEIYNLAAQSFVPLSWTQPEYTCEVTGLGVLRILEAMRIACPAARFYQASSSEQYGLVRETPQTETTPFYPRSPYGVAKVFGHQTTVNYRESYGLFACCGITMNHESPRRGLEFVTRKITNSVAKIRCGKLDRLKLGNTSALRDWGFAGDYVEAMWLMLQQDMPQDFVIATGRQESVQFFLENAFGVAGFRQGEIDLLVETDEALYRPAEVNTLLGDASKARKILGWEPRTSLESLIEMMVANDLQYERN